MVRSFLVCLTAVWALSGCFWNNNVPETDSWQEPDQTDQTDEDTQEPAPSSPDFYSPNRWTLELWGYYDGERLTDFRYHSGNSGAVPAFAILRFTDPYWREGEEDCYWGGAVVIQGWTVLTDDQYDAWGFTLEKVDSDCKDFDPTVWLDTSPTVVMESLYWTVGFRPPTNFLKNSLDRGTDGPMGWAYAHDSAAFTLQLGFEWTLGTWEHFEAGASYAVKTDDGAIVIWDSWGRPYPQILNGEIEGHVIISGTMEPLPISLFGH
jgi:hypothetical protein